MAQKSEQGEFAEKRRKFISKGLFRFRKEVPEIARPFMDFWRATKQKSPIPTKYKELIQRGIVMFARCESCIYQHVESCVRVGASREEILDAAAQAVAIGGGIVYEYIPYVLDAIDLYAPPEDSEKE